MQTRIRALAFRPIVALVICIIGISWALIVILRGGGTPTPIASVVPKSGDRTLVVATPPPHDFDASKAKEFANRTTDAVRGAAERVATSPVNPADSAAIAREASDTLNLAIYPTAQKYMEYLRERGEPDGPFAKLSESERDVYVRSKSDSFAGQVVDLSKCEARWRYINGRALAVPMERGGYETTGRSNSAVQNPGTSGLTVLEILVPVPAKTLLKGTQPCRLGIWIGKTHDKPNWTTMRIYTYDTPPTAGVMTPLF